MSDYDERADGGACYGWVCGEVSYYKGVQAPQYPISTQAVVPMVSLRVPVWEWGR